MVIGYHARTVPTNSVIRAIEYPLHTFGWAGVDLFFVLSGFLIGGILLKEVKDTSAIDAKRFLFRRAFKIWPAYYAFLLVQVAAGIHPIRTFLLANVLNVQNYFGTSLNHTWSLAVEEHFYLGLVAAVSLMSARGWSGEKVLKALLWTMVAVVIVRSISVFIFGPSLGIQWATHTRIDSLLLGVVLAALFQFVPATFERLANRKWALAGTLCLAIIVLACSGSRSAFTQSIGYTILYLGAGSALLLAYRHSGHFTRTFLYRWTARLGLYSYGIYLWHNSAHTPSMRIAEHFTGLVSWLVLMICQFGIAIFLGVLATRIVEWPFLRLRERLAGKATHGIGTSAHIDTPAEMGQLYQIPERVV